MIVDAVIEVPKGTNQKYEQDEDGNLRLDRILSCSMVYPANYGFVPKTIGSDGDELDILVLTPYSLVPHCVISCRVIGVLNMEDEGGTDEKIIAVPCDKVDKSFSHIKDVSDLSPTLIREIVYFFERYKDLDKNKWSKVGEIEGIETASELIEKYRTDFVRNQK